MTKKNAEMRRIENAASNLKRDLAWSAVYFTGKIATICGAGYELVQGVSDALHGNFGSFAYRAVLGLACVEAHTLFNLNYETTNQRIKRNKLVLESKLAEDYGK